MLRSCTNCLRSTAIHILDSTLQVLCWASFIAQLPVISALWLFLLPLLLLEVIVRVVIVLTILPFIIPLFTLELIRGAASVQLGFPGGFPPDLPLWTSWPGLSS